MSKDVIRVLLVDDDEDYFFLTKDLISEIRNKRFDLEWVSSYDDAREAIARDDRDVYLLDYNLGAHNGLELLREAIDNGCRAPLIMLTGQGDEAVDNEAMNTGAADYLVKGRIDASTLERSIRYALERAKTLDALRESEERYSLAVRGAKDGVWDWNLKTNEVYFSGRWMAMIGADETETKGDPTAWFNRVHADDSERVKTEMEAHLEGITPHFECEFRMQHADGGYRWVLGRGMAFRDGSGKPLRITGTISQFPKPSEATHARASRIAGTLTDITDKKHAEETLRQIEDQLRQAQKMESIGRLAGGVAHDFNNMLTAIIGYCEHLLKHGSTDGPLRREIEEIRKAGERAACLTRQLLAFSRRQMLQPKVLNLNSVVLDMEKMLRRLINQDVELLTVLSPDLGAVKVDPNQLEQVLLNLALNARDAMEGGGQLTIETANVDLDEQYARAHVSVVPGPYVALTVRDTGVGMTEQVKVRLFEPFFTTKEQGKGTGLGLPTVYGIVRQSGGDISVDSESGKGTTFRIHFPRVQEPVEVWPAVDLAGELPRGNETLLLVEDEQVVREMEAMVLREQGYTVLEAADGEEALRLVETQPGSGIHLLLTDVSMPKMGGKELADRLKVRAPDMRVLFASGYTKNSIVHNGVVDAQVEFLPKPFSLVGLSHKVREVLDRADAGSIA